MPHQSSQGHDFLTPFDLKRIFIGRKRELAAFERALQDWRDLMTQTGREQPPVTAEPSPQEQIQGFVALLYGHGGFGKSTLLRRYRASAEGQNQRLNTIQITLSKIIDWEFAIGGSRGLFHSPSSQEPDAAAYFQLLCRQLAEAFQKKPGDFKQYQKAIKLIEQARRDAHQALDNLTQEEQFAGLRRMVGEGVVQLIRLVAPRPGQIMDMAHLDEQIKKLAGVGAEIGAEHLVEAFEHLRAKLKERLEDYLDPALRLGLALGEDLQHWALKAPLLVFFDTYEEIDEGDRFLRMVMAAAGSHVGWVLAGRDNLWASGEQEHRSSEMIYGYKDLVPLDRCLPVDFTTSGVGTFSSKDIQEYFDQLCQQVRTYCPLPTITQEGARQVREVTLGVPLAVQIAAGIYLETRGKLEEITKSDKGKGHDTLVGRMVERYLLHTRADQNEKAKLYALALLRRADQPPAVAAALGLTPKEAETGYTEELNRLHRRYSFIFTEKEEPALHQEVRHFLRLWLLKHRTEPEQAAIIERLKSAQMERLLQLEADRQYSSLEQRLEDDEWVNSYLDITEQQFWADPAQGVRHALLLMIAAAIYQDHLPQEMVQLGSFFESQMKAPYCEWWHWAATGLVYQKDLPPSNKVLVSLKALLELLPKQHLAFPAPLPDSREELEAALWWLLGDAFLGTDNTQAVFWYEQALSRLGKYPALLAAAAYAYIISTHELPGTEGFPLLERAIELEPSDTTAYMYRAAGYSHIGQYQRAIEDYTQALTLDPTADTYYRRGSAYYELGDYQHAIEDYTRALALRPKDAEIYESRGKAYQKLADYEHCIEDFTHAITIVFNSPNAWINRGSVYYELQEYQHAIDDFTQAIAAAERSAEILQTLPFPAAGPMPEQEATADHIFTVADDPDAAWAYSYRALAFLWQKDLPKAQADFQRCSELYQIDINRRWMAMWAGMGKERGNNEAAERLEQIASIKPTSYVACVCQGVALGLRGHLKQGLEKLEQAIQLDPEEWDAYFWKGLLCAYFYPGKLERATTAIEKALEVGLPPILLTPLYWLEKERPKSFTALKVYLERYGV
jgi:tetratricopeptide (TPR) repeat protein